MSDKKIYSDIPRPYALGLLHLRGSRFLKQYREQVLEAYHLTTPQWFALGVLSEYPKDGLTTKRLHEILGANQTYVTATIGSLKVRKLVVSKDCSEDRRKRVLHLTDDGRRIVTDTEEKLQNASDRLLAASDLNERDLLGYVRILESLAHSEEIGILPGSTSTRK